MSYSPLLDGKKSNDTAVLAMLTVGKRPIGYTLDNSEARWLAIVRDIRESSRGLVLNEIFAASKVEIGPCWVETLKYDCSGC